MISAWLLGGAWPSDGCAADSGTSLRVTTLSRATDPRDDRSPAPVAILAPGGVAVDRSGNLYVSETDRDMGFGNTIRKITLDGVMTILAGAPGRMGFRDGTAGDAQFSVPEGVAVDAFGTIYVADSHNHVVRKIDADNVVTTLSADFRFPVGIGVDRRGNLYVGDTYNHVIRMITPRGEMQTVAGAVGMAGSLDGTGDVARFDYPQGVCVDDDGNVFVADTGNGTIRKITPDRRVTTLAGTRGVSGAGDGVGDAAQFGRPAGVAVDRIGNVYVTDATNHTIRKVTPGGVVSTVAGMTGTGGNLDGIGPNARFFFPVGIALDSKGKLYVADMGNDRVRIGVFEEAPIIDVHPTSQTIAEGSTVVFTTTANAAPAPSYQWEKNGSAIAGATDAVLIIPSATELDAASYTCVVSNSSGVTVSRAALLSVTNAASAGRLVNVSVRATAGGVTQPLIVGFAFGGSGASGPANVLVRAAGPALNTFGATGLLADPGLEILHGDAVLASNDNWGTPDSNRDSVQAAEVSTGAFPFSNPSGLDAALVAALPQVKEGYSARITGASPGTALVEIYDVAKTSGPTTPRLIKASVQTKLDAFTGPLTAGFTLGGTTARTVLIRATFLRGDQVMQSLGSGSLKLVLDSVVAGASRPIAAGESGTGDAAVATVARAVGAPSLTATLSADAAILRSLPPGGYTVGVSAAGGDVLLELYEVP